MVRVCYNHHQAMVPADGMTVGMAALCAEFVPQNYNAVTVNGRYVEIDHILQTNDLVEYHILNRPRLRRS